MSPSLLFMLLLLIIRVHGDEDSELYGTCNQTFQIGKNTVATSDSKRDYWNAYNIFPFIHDQDASHFIDGYCSSQCKLELPDTCFKIHMPQTPQHDEGLLSVKILENKFTKKWTSVMSSGSVYPYHYDTFFDFNMAYWVKSLDPYISKWNTFNYYVDIDKQPDTLKLEYFGIEWIYDLKDDEGEYIDLEANNDDTFIDNIFYSLLIHSPSSQVIYEFVSYTKPSIELYDSVKWIHSNIPRVTFKTMKDPYPWNRQDTAYIVPVRKSRATTNIDAVYTFYVDIMEANVSYYTPMYIMDDLDGDNVPTRVVTVALPGSHIELQFIQRPWQYTAGDFKLIQYESLLRETHDSIITSPFCGLDRWADNHYGYGNWAVDGYLERVLTRLTERKLKYRVYKSFYEHTSEGSRKKLEEYNKTEAYMSFVFEPTGQTIQLGGDLNDKQFTEQVPVWSAQWCYRECAHGLKDGQVNTAHIYVDTEDYDIRKLNVEKAELMLEGFDEERRVNMWLRNDKKFGFVSMVLVVYGLVMYALYYYELNQMNSKYNEIIDDCTPLIHK